MTQFTQTLAAARTLREIAARAEAAARAGDHAALQHECDSAESLVHGAILAGASDEVLSRYSERLWEELEQLWP